MLWAAVLGGAGLALVSPYVVPLLFGAEFRPAIGLIAILIPATVILGMNRIIAAAFQGVGRPAVASKANVVALIVTLAALALLLPPYGAHGAAVSSLLACASSHLYLARQAIRILGADPKSMYSLTRADMSALSMRLFPHGAGVRP
jgi:O-antigen/teichoic acid export membrane protein